MAFELKCIVKTDAEEDQANRKAAKGGGLRGLDYHCYW